MRVILWRDVLLPRTETFIRRQGAYLASQGINVTFAGLLKSQSPIADDNDRILYPASPFTSALYRLFRIFGRSCRLARAVKGLKPDLIHAHFLPDGGTIARVSRRLQIPLVVTAHGQDATALPTARGPGARRARRRMFRAMQDATLIIAVSDFIRFKLHEMGVPAARTVTHYVGIEVSPSIPTLEEKYDFCFVGRFVEKKGVLDLIKALAEMPELSRARTVMIGDGPLYPHAVALAQNLGVHIDFQGVLAPDDTQRVIAESRVVVVPSRTARDGDTEGLPTVVIEAAALARPVVATSHAGIPEGVIHGLTGLLSPEGDIAKLAANLVALHSSPTLAGKLGRAGRQLVETKFNSQTQTRELIAIYRSVVAGGS